MGGLTRGLSRTTRGAAWTPVSGWARWSHALLLIGVAVMFGLGLYLTPDARGHGTHQQLGLPPCTVYYLTGRPCPSCGLTTSVSAILHGQFALAWRANPTGFLIVGAAVAVALHSLIALIRGYALRIEPRRFNLVLIGLLTLWLLHGLIRFALG
ncbi:MAG: DUF2752 domain-containing protein [Fimbriimonadales bacterium]|nr:DUF2752 domain-containing protein [Fimbriimonadales bacterium]